MYSHARYDVTAGAESFGVGGAYSVFAGHDCTLNLSSMSLEKATLDATDYSLDGEERLALAEWILYFDVRYGAPVGVIDHAELRHPLTLAELPTPAKIPFAKSTKKKTTSKL